MAVPKNPLVPPPPSPRVRITETGRILHIVIPARRCWGTIFLSALLLVPWAIMGICLLYLLLFGEMQADRAIRVLFAAIFWGLWGVSPLFALLWNLQGREIVVVEGATLWIRWAIGKRGYTREFRSAHLENLRVAPDPFYGDLNRLWQRPTLGVRYGFPAGAVFTRSGSGRIAFEYGGSPFRFGQGLQDSEAVKILSAVERRLPPL